MASRALKDEDPDLEAGKKSLDNPGKPLSRFEFSKDKQYNEFPGDEIGFRKWWVGDDDQAPAPPFKSRVQYFISWAPLEEVALPGREMERALGGHKKDMESYLYRLLTYVLCPIYIFLILLVFIIGLCSFGLLWPKDMRRRIFYGDESLGQKHKDDALSARIDSVKYGVDSIKADVHTDHVANERLEDQVQNLHKKLDEMTKLLERQFEDDATSMNSSTNFNDSSLPISESEPEDDPPSKPVSFLSNILS